MIRSLSRKYDSNGFKKQMRRFYFMGLLQFYYQHERK